MSTMHQSQGSRRSAPSASQGMRTVVACLNCRTRKVKCMPTSGPPMNPCAHCKMYNLICEYVSPGERERARDNDITDTETPSATSWTHDQPMQNPPAASSGGRGRAPPPLLPYTASPPPGTRARYSHGHAYPDLALAAQTEPPASRPGRYTPHAAAGPESPARVPAQSTSYYQMQAAHAYQYLEKRRRGQRAPTHPGAGPVESVSGWSSDALGSGAYAAPSSSQYPSSRAPGSSQYSGPEGPWPATSDYPSGYFRPSGM